MSSQIPLSVVLLGEARELLNVLRRNRRFSYLLSFTTTSQPAEHPLVKEVKSIRDIVRVTNPTSSSRLLTPPEVLLKALDPFLEVVRSRDASGIITGHALLSLDRIVTRLLSLVQHNQCLPQYSQALCAIVDAAAACRFDATDPASDEVVVARITRVVGRVVTSPALPFLSDATILRAVESCLGIAAGKRRASDLLKRTADAVLVDVFSAVGYHARDICAKTGTEEAGRRSVVADGVIGSVFGYALDSEAFSQHCPATVHIVCALLELCARMSDPTRASSEAERALGMQLVTAIVSAGGTRLTEVDVVKQFLVRDCSRAVLRSLGAFRSHPSIASASFTIAIQLVHILEEDGVALLLAMLERVYPYYISGYEGILPQTSRDTDVNGVMIGGDGGNSLNGASPGTSSTTVTGVAVPIDSVVREIGLESLAALLSSPGLLCIVYRVADCDLCISDVVNPLLKALGLAARARRPRRRSKRLRASSSGANRSTAAVDDESDEDDTSGNGGNETPESSRNARAASLLCAESILAIVDTISDRLKLQSDGSAERPEGDDDLLHTTRKIRLEKVRLQRAADVFNTAPKMEKATRLLQMLREHGLAPTVNDAAGTVSQDLDEDVSSIVSFLRKTPGLNKTKIGMILGEPDKLSCRILEEFTATFKFEDRPLTESLRVFLETFRLPGESQKIDRVLQSFAEQYYGRNKLATENHKDSETAKISDNDQSQIDRSNKDPQSPVDTDDVKRHHSIGVLKSSDAAFILSYSIIMLNTDQHNDSVRKKMTLEDFLRNCRGINEGEDVPKWFMEDIFNSISAVEIQMSDEAGIATLTDVLWDEQLREMKQRRLPAGEDPRVFDEELFMLSWEPAVVASNSILNEAGDANSVQKALEGFLSVARCATAYGVSRPTDAVISSLVTATTLLGGPLYGAITRFGTDIKAQMASVALSGVSRQCADGLESDGWQSLVAYLLRLHGLNLLPKPIEQELGGYGTELVGIGQQEIPASKLIPRWWPSQSSKGGEENLTLARTRKPSRPNGFFALLAGAIGTDVGSDDDDDFDNIHAPEGDGRAIRRTSQSPPFYLKMRSNEEKEACELARKCIAGCRIEDIVIREAKILHSFALQYLSKAIARSASRIMDAGKTQKGPDGEDVSTESSGNNSLLDWKEIAPSSPKDDSSVIVGSSMTLRRAMAAESEYETPHIQERDERKAREFVVAFCIDLLCELTLQNRDRLHLPWPALHGFLERVIAPATQPSAVLERAVVALLRVGVRLLHRDEVKNDVLRGLNLLVRLPPDTADILSIPIAAGVYNIVKVHASTIKSTSGWHAIISILESLARYQPEAREIGLESISCMLKDRLSTDAVSPETFTPLLDAILAYTMCSSIDVSIRALDLLYHLSQRVSRFNEVAPSGKGTPVTNEELWSECWGPLFLGLASSVRDARGKVRNSALEVLERVVASGASVNMLLPLQWSHALSNVILPLMTQLFSTNGFLEATLEAEQNAQKKLLAQRKSATSIARVRSRNAGVSAEHQEQLKKSVLAACNRTRMRAVTLTSKTFLQHHLSIASGITEDAFTELWIGVLEVFRVAIESGPGDDVRSGGVDSHDDLAQHVVESIKNLILVMSDCGLLKTGQHVRWNATFSVVRKFAPNIEEVINATTSSVNPPQNKNGNSEAPYSSSPDKQEVMVHTEDTVDLNGNVPSSTVATPLSL